ncbi:hypothetical protein Vadar_028448 [Vaccinium darrowii]|uniref:Uncharacterized protein n=1 Tax=Vaccinium darrowii TaxID=229202 RepID=A0ACB7X4Q0_9ERIC|nr:hypothetical protein Vadar_028448 [Vaccinium darrowii]
MDDMKDKVKGFMKKVNNPFSSSSSSSGKFKGHGRVLGSSSSLFSVTIEEMGASSVTMLDCSGGSSKSISSSEQSPSVDLDIAKDT